MAAHKPTGDDVLALVSAAASAVDVNASASEAGNTAANNANNSAAAANAAAAAVAAAAAASSAAVVHTEQTMQQLLLQVQAQQAHLQQLQAQAQAQVQAQLQLQAATVAAAAAAATAMNVGHLPTPHKTDTTTMLTTGMDTHTAMDLMPLSAAAVVIGSPTHGGADRGVVSAGNGVGGAGVALRRKSIPLSMKKEAIEWIAGPGKGVPSRAEKHFSALNWDVSASSFRKWWNNRDRIMNDSSSKKRISGGGRKPYLEESEEKLLVIVIQERAKKDRVTRKWVAKTAQHMFQRSNANFKASENWVTKFIKRNGLTLKRSYVTYEQDGQGVGDPSMGLPPGTIVVHDDGDDEDDDDDDEVATGDEADATKRAVANTGVIV